MNEEATPPDARSRILDAAEAAFAEGGLAGARVAAIADVAGVNKAMLYYYFDSKEALYTAVLGRVFEDIVRLAEQVGAVDEAPAATALVDFAEGYARILGEHPNIPRILARGLLDSGPEVLEFARPKIAQVLPLLAKQVLRGQSDGTVNPALTAPLVPPALVAPMVFITLAGPLISQVTGLDVELIRAMWLQNIRELSLNGLVARPREDP